jgi:hypothetical protein
MSYDKRQVPVAREYWYAGRNGCHFVDQLRPSEGSGTYGDTVNVSTSRKSGREVTSALNEAFAAGVAFGRMLATRLEYLRGEIQAERISTGELTELQSLAAHIEPGDTELLEWAGVPEHETS